MSDKCKKIANETIALLFYKEPLIASRLTVFAGCIEKPDAYAMVLPDGTFYVSTRFTEVSARQRITILAHEALHVLFHHLERFEKWSEKYKQYSEYDLLKIFNYAADSLINEMLNASGFDLPPNVVRMGVISQMVGLPVEELITMSAEEIADLLVKHADKIPEPRDGFVDSVSSGIARRHCSGCSGNNVGRRLVKPPSKRNAYEGEIVASGGEELVEQAKNIERMAGRGAGGLTSIIKSAFTGLIDWRQKLRNLLGSWARNVSRSWRRPNTRLAYTGTGVLVPGVKRSGANIVVVADVSGSMLGDLEYVFGEVDRALKATGGAGYAVFFDDGVRAVLKGRVKGKKVSYGGGTVITPALRVAESLLRRGDMLVVISDFYLFDQEDAYNYLRKIKQSKRVYPVFLVVGDNREVIGVLKRVGEVIPVEYVSG